MYIPAFGKRTTTPRMFGFDSTDFLTFRRTARHALEGLWRSEGGSLYICDGQAMVCVSVHSAKFRGWIGKVAVRGIHCTDGIWRGWQAFRSMQTGALTDWQPITLSVADNRIIKYFPESLSAGVLVYGHIEHYYRVNVH
ncbi:MAG: hypothetical protein KZQ96_20685 [Candidatus Thiodiazotropha sp. (ex Lucinoma borealis)]|nr:hypothetical protein [Candidatus Thiodiazotropha sp. (ex Lucinoma borealis)]